ncbi:MAG: GNAT family N-acetyltransferase [Candidatus Acidiferrum sp.]
MQIRTFAPGDEVAQVGIYNEAAAELPKFKAATLDEVRRRNRSPEFDAKTRFVAVENGRVVGYANFNPSGRVSFPWTRKGAESVADELFEHALNGLRERGVKLAFAAYRGDWEPQRQFFLAHAFEARREIINFVMDLAEMPTPAARANSPIGPLTPADLPLVADFGKGLFRSSTAADLERRLLRSPYFPADAVFVLRSKTDATPVAMGLVVSNAAYANAKQVDSAMPCFRAGAFGTEGLQVKKMNGLFSVVASSDRDASPLALDLLSHAALRLLDTDVETLCAQIPSDAAQLVRFYKQYFRRQASFPLYEREL